MRTSGDERDNDILLLVAPVLVAVVAAVYFLGGPEEFLRNVDVTMTNSMNWVSQLWR
jgi:hypothetical protein